VNGVAAGAGANIAFACDIVLAARSAKFIQAFAKIGLVPDAGGTWSLTRILGEPRAKALALTAEPLAADKAADWGLIWRAVDDTELLMEEARQFASSLAAGPTLGPRIDQAPDPGRRRPTASTSSSTSSATASAPPGAAPIMPKG
jgi:2-(1,2-epoxy-1,2-dihydrophenyl)acetyl-CoA isomerase